MVAACDQHTVNADGPGDLQIVQGVADQEDFAKGRPSSATQLRPSSALLCA